MRTMAAGVTKNTGDVENYSKEFIELQRQLNQVRHQKFNGISLFATSSSPASTTAPELRPQLDKQGLTLDDQGRGYAKFSRQILTTADGVVADGHVPSAWSTCSTFYPSAKRTTAIYRPPPPYRLREEPGSEHHRNASS